MMQKPDVDQIDGLSPAISIEQKTTSKNPRSTVGKSPRSTTTCACSGPRPRAIRRPQVCRSRARWSQMVDTCWRCRKLPPLFRAVVRGRRAIQEGAEYLKGFSASRSTAPSILASAPALDKKFPHDIDVVVDRIVVRADIGQRLAEVSNRAEARQGPVIEYAAPRLRARRGQQEEDGEDHDKAAPASCSRSLPARFRASPSPRSSRGCSPSTIPMAPARPAAGSASSSTSTRISSSPTRS